jgi:AcrR family transcriptional regulator
VERFILTIRMSAYTGTTDQPDEHADTAENAEVGAGETRERILRLASELFARHGYHGTSTRDIAAAVGIRQPSLFHHFATKAAIMHALLEMDLGVALPRAEALVLAEGPAAVRLYRYLRDDIAHLTSLPYNLSSLYSAEVSANPEFAEWSRKRLRLHRAIERMLAEGMASGEFLPQSARLVREAITGVLVHTLLRSAGLPRPADEWQADAVATFILRALLAEPEEADNVARAAQAFRVQAREVPDPEAAGDEAVGLAAKQSR